MTEPVEKINDLLKDYDVDAEPQGRYTRLRTQPEQWASEDGLSAGLLGPNELVECGDCGVAVSNQKKHDRHHIYLAQRRGTQF